MKIDKTLVVSISFLGSLFGSQWQSCTVSAEGLALKGDKSILLKWIDIKEIPDLKKGFLSGSLKFNFEGQEINSRWLNKKELILAYDLICQYWIKTHIDYFLEKHAEVISIFETEFPEKEQITRCKKIALDALKLLKGVTYFPNLNAKEQEALRGLVAVSEMSSELLKKFRANFIRKEKDLYQKQKDRFNTALKRYDQQWLQYHMPPLRKLSDEIQQVLKTRYFKTSYIRKFQQQAQEILDPIAEKLKNIELHKKDQAVVDSLNDIAQMTDAFIENIRTKFLTKQKERYKKLFDTIESNPLTEAQRNACIIDEDNNLVIAGAGTGKTSVMVGRAAYLIKSGLAKPQDLLLLAYNKTAAEEIRERLEEKLKIDGIYSSTFHALGYDILAKSELEKQSVNPLAQDEKALSKFIENTFTKLLLDPHYKKQAIHYFQYLQYPDIDPFNFETQGEYYDSLKANNLRTLKPEQSQNVEKNLRALKGERVKSWGELQIANWLFSQGVDYRYEKSYEPKTADPNHKNYQPDFYLPGPKIYIEYLGLDKHNKTAPFIDNDKYIESLAWKRKLHKKNNTRLLELYYHELKENKILDKLKEHLEKFDVVFEPISDEEMLKNLQEFGAINSFSSLLGQILKSYKSSWLSPEQITQKINTCKSPIQAKAVFELLQPIVEAYDKKLKEEDSIDFDDMIGKAIDYTAHGDFNPKWKYILVDEFQDISEPRARLVKKICDAVPDSTLFCVGDDWQSIYRFAGSDINLTTSFANHFGPTITTELDKTFRFNDKICDVASTFIMENPGQIRKSLTTHEKTIDHGIILMRSGSQKNNDISPEVHSLLNYLSSNAARNSSVYLLARYNFQIPDNDQLHDLREIYPKLNINALTIHRSKGKEADYIIILGLEKGPFGFPSEKPTHPLLELLLPKEEEFSMAEERRLFYVALTRAKKQVFLLSDMTNASSFIQELKDKKYTIHDNISKAPLEQKFAEKLKCKACEDSSMKKRTGTYGSFAGCSHFPLCKETDITCPTCDEMMVTHKDFNICIEASCQTAIPICPHCQKAMVERINKKEKNKFWGCRNYPRCTHTKNKNTAHQNLIDEVHSSNK